MYFERPQGGKIQDMQTFDEASRGPWGSATFLWKTKGAAGIASLGAVITMFMIAFEPFTQQGIVLRPQNTTLVDSTGYVTVANAYTNSSLVDGDMPLSQSMLALVLKK